MKHAKKYVMTPYQESAQAPAASESDVPGLDDIQFGSGFSLGSLTAPGIPGDPGDTGPLARNQVTQFPQSAQDGQAALAPAVTKKKNAIRERALDKATKSAKIMSRLAMVNGYNENFEIKLRTGKYLSGSNLIYLVWHVLAPAREVQGLKEFTELLSDAGVMSEWIDNPNVRASLSNMAGSQRPAYSTQSTAQAQLAPTEVRSRRFVSKRRGEESVEEPTAPSHKRRRLEDQLAQISSMRDSAPSLQPESESAIEEPRAVQRRPSKRTWEDKRAELAEESDGDELMEAEQDEPLDLAPRSQAEVLRKRKQKIARRLGRPGDWSDSND